MIGMAILPSCLAMNLTESSHNFLSHCRSAVSLSNHTLRAYTFDLCDFCTQAGPNQQLASVTKETLRKYIQHLRETRMLKETTIKRRIACLKLLFRWLKQEGLIGDNPFDSLHEKIRLPKRLPRALPKNDAQLLRAASRNALTSESSAQQAAKLAIQVMLATGIRVGELVALRRQDIDLTNASLTIQGKGNRQRLVYLVDPTVQASLERHIARLAKETPDIEAVFLDKGGRPLTTNQVRRLLRTIANNAGIERRITPHMLRHTSATTWLESGLDIRYVQKLLGHQSISTTEIYTQITDEGLRGAMRRAAER